MEAEAGQVPTLPLAVSIQRELTVPPAACSPLKTKNESASVVTVTSVVPVGAKVTPLLKVVVAFTLSVSADASPSTVEPLAVSVPVSVVAPVTAKALLIVVVPVPAPIATVVAAPPIFNVVTPALRRLNVVCVEVISPPLTAISPLRVRLPDLSRLATVVPEAEADKIF